MSIRCSATYQLSCASKHCTRLVLRCLKPRALSKLSEVQMCFDVYIFSRCLAVVFSASFPSSSKVVPGFLSFVKMSLFVLLLVCSMVPHVCAASALPPARTIIPDRSPPQVPPLNAPGSPVCVKAAQNPDWAGTIDERDCADAIVRLWDRVSPYGYIQWTFWASSLD